MPRPPPSGELDLDRAGAARPTREVDAPAPTGTVPLLDDAEMIAKVRRGDPRAATALYERARPTVRRLVGRLLGRVDAEHEDVVQTALIAIVDSVERFRGESSLDTWFARITANIVWRVFRGRASERRLLASSRASEDEARVVDSAHASYEARELLGRVRNVLGTMDPLKAYPVLLFDVCGYDLKEIAEITHSTVAAAQTRLVRGRAELLARRERR